ncbi:MAG: Eco57I restriction-modification methylase domain-containing protein [Bacteroidota bacterium]
MVNLDIQKTRVLLEEFDFNRLFIEELGWSQPTQKKIISIEADRSVFQCKQIAQLAGVIVFEVLLPDDDIPPAKIRQALYKQTSKLHHENLLIFINKKRTKSLWYWEKREQNKRYPREHYYLKGQPGDLFLTKLSSMVVDITELDEKGEISVLEVAGRLKKALDVEATTKKFFKEYDILRLEFVELIGGIPDERKRKWYASVLLNRLMFIYFLQEKFFLDDGNKEYLIQKLEQSKKTGKDIYYSKFLKILFFEGFAKPENERSANVKNLLGKIKYLNGGLFILHPIEEDFPDIDVPDKAFDNLFSLFHRYSWNLNDTPGGKDDEINPDVLGYIFEKYINQKEFGAYYTRPEITEYLCERTISKLILAKVNAQKVAGVKKEFTSLSEMLLEMNAPLCKYLLKDVLPGLSLLDPACGSGAFLVAAMKSLINIYSAIIGKITFLNDAYLTTELRKIEKDHPSKAYFIKKSIITNNLYGVDIMEEAIEIAKLRLFLALVAAAKNVDELEPLPNIDFNLMTGNSLIGLRKVERELFEESSDIGTQSYYNTYTEALRKRNILVKNYRDASGLAEDLHVMRDNISKEDDQVNEALHTLLLDQFHILGIKYEQATWDEKKNKEGKIQRRGLVIKDITDLHPFHWGFEFDEIIHKNGGFDAIITNPPWEVFQTNEKEFFQQFAPTIQKKKLRIEEWETQRENLLNDPDIGRDWLEYASRFPHQLGYFKKSSQFSSQLSIVNGNTVGNKPNLYCLFIEQCYNLLRPGGDCGIVIPSGIYTDLGTKQLREMLFGKTNITGLFCFENSKAIFEGVHRSFKFVVLTFEKGSTTTAFPAAFMRHDVEELDQFPNNESIRINVDLVRKLSPDSLSIPEFKSTSDVNIAAKLLNNPPLSDSDNGWGLELYGEELNMTRSAKHFMTKSTGYPVFEGGMIWHFDHRYSNPRYWVVEPSLREEFLEKKIKRIEGIDKPPRTMINDYEVYRIGIRKIASNTNERTLISTILPRNCLAGNSLTVNFPFIHDIARHSELRHSSKELLVIVTILNSYVADYILRSRMTTNLNLFFLYQLPVPHLATSDKYFREIVERAGKLICTTQEFDELAKEIGLGSHKNGVTDETGRAKLRAELDGIVAHLYGFTEEEFAYILTTFPIVPQPVKDAALQAYKDLAPKTDEEELKLFIATGESATAEFKSSLRWDMRENKLNRAMEQIVVKTVAGFLNAEGGTLLIGVEDSGNIVGLGLDYKTLGKHQDKDGFEVFLTTLLLNTYGKDISPCIKTTFHAIDGKEICKVIINPSPRAIYVKDEKGEQFFVRTGNATNPLSMKEAVEYCKRKWKE